MKMRIHGLFCLLLSLAMLAPAQDTATREATLRSAVLEAAETYRRDNDVPGLSLAVLKEGRTLVSGGLGYRDVGRKLAATERTVYRLASISKAVTAVLLMRQVDRKKIHLDAGVRTYVREFPEKRWTPTVRQLASHLSGIRHYQGPGDPTTRVNRRLPRCSDAMKLFVNDPLLHEPGTKWHYSTHAFTVLGAALESVSGKPFNELLAQEVKQQFKLGTPVAERDLPAGAERSLLYLPRSARESRPDDLSWKEPGGGMVASAKDLARFADQVLRGSYLSQGARKQMWTAGKTAAGKSTGYGLGFGVAAGEKRRSVSHSGSQNGAASYLRIYPEQAVVVVILSNCTGHRPARLAGTLEGILFP